MSTSGSELEKKTCFVCKAEISSGDLCQKCFKDKIVEFRRTWRWLTPQNKICVSVAADGHRCGNLARHDSDYCPPCRSKYDKSARCEWMLFNGEQCSQMKTKGGKYCWTHQHKIEKGILNEKEKVVVGIKERLAQREITSIDFSEIAELGMLGKIEPGVGILLSLCKIGQELETWIVGCRTAYIDPGFEMKEKSL